MPVKGVVSICCVASVVLTLSINSAVAGSETTPAKDAASSGAVQKKISVATAMTDDEYAAIHAYNKFNSALIRKQQEQDTSSPSQLTTSLQKVTHALHIAVKTIKDFLDN